MRRTLIVAMALLYSVHIHAQKSDQGNPALERGLHPEKMYQFNGFDNVSVFNGNLGISLPIGPSYAVDGGLSYQLSLYHNSKLWDFDRTTTFSHAYPAHSSNAGLGWILGFGRFIAAVDPIGPGTPTYEAPDGGEHPFEGNYTTDGTNLRYRELSPTLVEIDFPDGIVQQHKLDSDGVSWILTEIRAPRGTGKVELEVLQLAPPQCGVANELLHAWLIKDTEGRKHYVCFKGYRMDSEDARPMVKKVVFEPPPNDEGMPPHTHEYELDYEEIVGIPRVMGEIDPGDPDHDPQWRMTHEVWFLKSLKLPDDSSWQFDHRLNDPILLAVTLPTKARVEYEYNFVPMPGVSQRCPEPQPGGLLGDTATYGVVKRTVFPAATAGAVAESQVWRYERELSGKHQVRPATCNDPVFMWDEMIVRVTDPAQNRVESHFTMWAEEGNPSPNGFNSEHYSLPWGKFDATQNRYLSQVHYDCRTETETEPCKKLRTTYVRHDIVPDSFTHPTLRRYPVHRLASQAVYDHGCTVDELGTVSCPSTECATTESGGCPWTKTESTDWDGFAHYRVITSSWDFGDPAHRGSKTVTTNWNKNPNQTNRVILPIQPWVLDIYDTRTTQEGVQTLVEQACFALGTFVQRNDDGTTNFVDGNGFLRGSRILAGTTPVATDLIARFELHPTELNPSGEKYYGGDATPLPSSAATATTACAALDALESATPAYATKHTWDKGVMATSQHTGASFLSLDLSIHLSGLATESRDTADPDQTEPLSTKYSYDKAGRIASIKPPDGALTTYKYGNAIAALDNGGVMRLTQPATAMQRTESPSGAVEARYEFDSLGRVVTEKKLLPDNLTFMRQEHTYDVLGRRKTSTVWGTASVLKKTEITYDGAGRTTRVIGPDGPDGSKVGFEYIGSRFKTRKESIWNGTANIEARTTEEYDGFGRLVKVTERSGTRDATNLDGTDVVTEYTYAVGDRLATVKINGEIQPPRTFLYDGRGFLKSEKHPESGQTFYDYDARGHVIFKSVPADSTFDLKFAYDSAERPTSVSGAVPGNTTAFRPLKELVYGTENGADDRRNGKLWKATRINYPVTDPPLTPDTLQGKITVTETYAYRRASGPQTDRLTEIKSGESGETVLNAFTQSTHYNELSLPDLVTYPKPLGYVRPLRDSVRTHYKNGRVDRVDEAIDSMTYAPNGSWFERKHANGITDVQTPDPDGMPRPLSISVNLPAACNVISSQPEDASAAAGSPVTFTVTSGAPGATFQWYQGARGDTRNPVSGAIANVLSIPSLTVTTSYWCRVLTASCHDDSRTATAYLSTGCNIITSQPTSQTIQPNQTAPFDIGVAPGATIQWFEGVHPIGTLVGTGSPFTTPPLVATTNYWARVTASGGTCQQDSVTVTANVVACNAPSFQIASSASTVLANTAFTLTSPTFNGATYSWYTGSYTSHTLIATTSVPSHTVAAGIAESTSFYVEVRDSSCNVTPVKSDILTVNVCAAPSQRTITATIESGTTVKLAVVDFVDGVTFQWFEGSSYSDLSKPLGTTASITVSLGTQKSYWVKMKRTCGSPAPETNTAFFVLDIACAPSIFIQPSHVSKLMPATATSVPLTTSVVAGKRGPFTYQWFTGEGFPLAGETGASYTSTFLPSEATGFVTQKRVYVVVTACGTSVPSETVTLTLTRTPQKIFFYTPGETLHGAYNASLSVRMDPEENGDHWYEYEWFEDDGTPSGRRLSATTRDINVLPSTIGVYWARITGTHRYGPDPNGNFGQYTEVTVSKKMFVDQYGSCELPELRVAQSYGAIPIGQSPLVTFQAFCDWYNVELEWYEGLTGDTRQPVTADAGAPNRLTVDSSGIRPYWVRAKLPCGTTRDSATLTYTRGACAPVVFNQHIASVNVAYGNTATLTVSPIVLDNPSYAWFEEGNTASIGSGTSFAIANVTESGRYFVKVRNLDCSTGTDSYIATVRVASCLSSSVTPPEAWKTEVWADKGTTPELSANTGGATSYQWYLGEVGNDALPIGGATLATYTTLALSADTMYWVRASGNGCAIDSPTITVKVCEPPAPVSTPRYDYSNTVPGQFTFLDVNMTGTKLQYQWYVGRKGVTTTPIDKPFNAIPVRPSKTTEYWVNVTALCGVGGNAPRSWPSETFTVSVCPVFRSVPMAAKTIVMPGTTTTLSVEVDRGDTVKWFMVTTPGGPATEIPGSGPSIDTPAINGLTTFFARATSGKCTKDSDPVTIDVCSGLSVHWDNGNRRQVEKDQLQQLAAHTGGGVIAEMDWYEGNNVGDIATSTLVHTFSNAYQVHPLATTSYWVRVKKDETGCYADTPLFTVNVCIPKIQTQPVSQTINAGTTATLSVTTDLTGMQYQWYRGAVGDTTNSLTGHTVSDMTSTISVSPSADTTYWVRVTGCNDGVLTPVTRDSQAATITVCQVPSIITQPVGGWTGSVGTTLTVVASGTELTYQWYKGLSSDTSMPQSSTSASFTVNPTQTTNYWVRVSGRCGTPVNSATAKVSKSPSITGQPVGGPIMTGTSRTLTVAASGTELTYAWYQRSGTSATLIAGATSSSYTTPPITANSTFFSRVYSGVAYTDSNDATLAVCSSPTVHWSSSPAQVVKGATFFLTAGLAAGETANFKWYRGTTSGDVANSTLVYQSSNAYQVNSLQATTSYWVRAWNEGTVCYSDSTVRTVNVCIPTILTQPQSVMIAAGASTTLRITTDNLPGVTYQWYRGQPGDTANPLANQTSDALTVTPSATTTYWARVQGCPSPLNPVTRDSEAATVSICQPPQITTQPAAYVVPRNYNLTINAVVTGDGLHYQWYEGAAGVVNTPVGTDSSAYSFITTVSKRYWVRIAGTCGSVDSTAALQSVEPVITTHPAGGPITKGTTRTLTVASSGTELTYAWYQRSGTTATLIPGATSSSYTTPPITADSTYFSRVYSGLAYTLSNEATLTVCLPSTFTIAASTNVSGSEVRLSVDAPVAGETFQWYRGASGDPSNPIGTGATTFVYPLETTPYWVRTTRPSCSADSAARTVNVCRPKVTTQPVSVTIPAGSSATLSVAATGTPPLYYAWYTGTPDTGGSVIIGANSSTYTTGPLNATTTYFARVTASSACSTRWTDSAAATVTVCHPPVITSQDGPKVWPWNSALTLQVLATGDDLHYQWYNGQAGDVSKPVGVDSYQYTFTTTNTTYYWVRITGSCGPPVNSNVIWVSVKPYIQTQPANATICGLGSTATFNVTAKSVEHYQWYRQVSGQAAQAVGGDSATLQIAVPQTPVEFWVVLSSGQASNTTSAKVTVTVNPVPTVTSFTAPTYGSTRYQLTALVASSDVGLVKYKFYQGTLGDTTTLLGDQALNYEIVTPPFRPITYWVRVYYIGTGCYVDRAVTIP